jgi:MATE family multidrug resistance protein
MTNAGKPLADAARLRTVARHARDTAVIAAPLAFAQLAQMAMAVTDTVLLGSLGPEALAAGGLGASLFFSLVTLMQGLLSAVSVSVANALGAQRDEAVAPVYWSALALAFALSVPSFALLSYSRAALVALGEPAPLAARVGEYTAILRWAALPAIAGLGLMRAFLPGIGAGRKLLVATLGGVSVNAFLNVGLIHGRFGLPRLGLAGSACATVITLWLIALLLLVLVHGQSRYQRFVRAARPRWIVVTGLLALGWPVAVTYAAETLLFLFTGLSAGVFGETALAAHQVVLNVASVAFMVPLAIAQAANVRVGFWCGAARPVDARRAGMAALALGGGFMALSGLALTGAPHAIIGLYVDLDAAGNAATIALASDLLRLAALFQIVDGLQTVAAGCLRGLRDTRLPMLLAGIGYWALGFPVGHWLAFSAHLGVRGLWCGLALGLAAVAILMCWRFVTLSGRAAAAS